MTRGEYRFSNFRRSAQNREERAHSSHVGNTRLSRRFGSRISNERMLAYNARSIFRTTCPAMGTRARNRRERAWFVRKKRSCSHGNADLQRSSSAKIFPESLFARKQHRSFPVSCLQQARMDIFYRRFVWVTGLMICKARLACVNLIKGIVFPKCRVCWDTWREKRCSILLCTSILSLSISLPPLSSFFSLLNSWECRCDS